MVKIISQRELQAQLKRAPQGVTPGGVVKQLRKQGAVIEGHPDYDTDLRLATEQENRRKDPYWRFAEWVTSPTAIGDDLGRMLRDKVSTGEVSAQSRAGFQQRLEDVGDVARIAIPVAAGVATAGASTLPQFAGAVGATFAAGATGSVIEDVTEFEEKDPGQIAKEAILEGGGRCNS